MRRNGVVLLPSEFQSLSGRINYIRQVSNNEYCSSCPECGGSIHQNGEYPDRFRMWRVSKHGAPMGWCRKCGHIWLPSSDNPPTKEQLETWRAEQIAVEERRKEEAEQALAMLRSGKLWESYHQMLDDYARKTWGARGISGEFWPEFWQLGYAPDKSFRYHCAEGWLDWTTPTLTIPIWDVGWQCLNIKHRLINESPAGDRYRSERKGLPAGLFVCNPDLPLAGKVMVVEGEIKAMVSYITLDDPDMQIVGVPSATPEYLLLDRLSECEPVYVLLDPDAFNRQTIKRGGTSPSPVERMVSYLGESRTRIIRTIQKVDDAINAGLIDKNGLRRLVQSATPARLL